MSKAPSASDMTNEPLEVRAQFRGTLFVLRAISMADYDKTVEMATREDPETKTEIFDAPAHTKILLSKSLVEPKMSIDELYRKDPRLVRGVQSKLRELYWDEEPDELETLRQDSEKIASKLGDDDGLPGEG